MADWRLSRMTPRQRRELRNVAIEEAERLHPPTGRETPDRWDYQLAACGPAGDDSCVFHAGMGISVSLNVLEEVEKPVSVRLPDRQKFEAARPSRGEKWTMASLSSSNGLFTGRLPRGIMKAARSFLGFVLSSFERGR